MAYEYGNTENTSNPWVRLFKYCGQLNGNNGEWTNTDDLAARMADLHNAVNGRAHREALNHQHQRPINGRRNDPDHDRRDVGAALISCGICRRRCNDANPSFKFCFRHTSCSRCARTWYNRAEDPLNCPCFMPGCAQRTMIPLIAVSDYEPWGEEGAGPPRAVVLDIPPPPAPVPPDPMENVRFVNIYATTNPAFPWLTSKNIILTSLTCVVGIIQWKVLHVYCGIDLIEIIQFHQFLKILWHLYTRWFLQALVGSARSLIDYSHKSVMTYCFDNDYQFMYSLMFRLNLYWIYKDLLILLTGSIFLFSAHLLYIYCYNAEPDPNHTNKFYSTRRFRPGVPNKYGELCNPLWYFGYQRYESKPIYYDLYRKIRAMRYGSLISEDLIRFLSQETNAYLRKPRDNGLDYDEEILDNTADYLYQRILGRRWHEREQQYVGFGRALRLKLD